MGSEAAGRAVVAGACWFCGKGPAGGESVAYPFDAQDGSAVRVVVVPRCDACAKVHRAQGVPSAVVIGAAALLPPVLVTLLVPASGLRTALNAVALILGVVLGIVLVSQRERRAAAKAGTRPAYDSREHEEFKALSADAAWRPRAGKGMNQDSSSVSFREETVGDYRRVFRNDAKALEALEEGCRRAGVAA